MLPLVVEAAVRSMALLVLVLLALRLMRVRNPHILMAAWQMVLAASLLMPFLAGWARFAVTPAGLPLPEILATDLAVLVAPSSTATDASPPAASAAAIDWLAVSTAVYLAVAAFLVLRLLVGCVLTWRLCRSASPVREDWTAGRDVRTNPSIAVPVTFGSTILLPPGYAGWDLVQRRAVLAHEYSHVSRGDFYVLTLASINRAVFWFNPLAWWLHRRIADLAEDRSDAAALQDIDDRVRYAEILLDLGSTASRPVVGLAMARAETVRRRVERILAETMLPKRMDWKAWAALAASILPLAVVVAGAVVAQVPMQGHQEAFWRRLEQQRPRKEVYIDPKLLDSYVGHFQLAEFKVLTVARLGDRLYVQFTGQEYVPVYPESAHKFFYKRVPRRAPAQISFVTDAEGRATELILHQHGLEKHARRVGEAIAKDAQQSFVKRVKEATPLPGSEAAVKRQIEALQQGKPAYHEMTENLAEATRRQIVRIERRLAALGPLRSISFRGVGAQGFDIYEAKFENGMTICRIYLADDGKVSGLLFQWGP
jgi:beta-lactamase regulating signal transducer with metallopeptidase domain